jgi:serine/threonine-protein kinase
MRWPRARRAELDAGLPPRLTALAESLRAEVAAREAAAARAALRDADPPRAPAAVRADHEADHARMLAAWRHVGAGADPHAAHRRGGRGPRPAARQAPDGRRAGRRRGALGRGYAADHDVPWATARPLLAPLADAPGLAGLAPAALARLAAVVPAVRDAFPTVGAAPAGDDPWAVLEAVRAAVEEVASEVPVLVAVDDLPRADAMTRQLVLALARRLPVANVCVAAAADDAELAAMPEVAALLDVPALHRVALAPAPATAASPASAPHPSAATAAPPPGTAAPARARRRRRTAYLAVAAAVGVLALGAGRLIGVPWSSATAVDASLVAVAPFDVADADLALWRHGVVDVLARRLDGAGALRTVPPTVVVRRFEGRGDPASAAMLGARTGAGLVVYGGLVHAGRDSVQLEARLYDVRRGEVVGEVRVADALSAMDRAVDALGIGLLRELARTRPLGAVRTAGVAAASLPALRAFLAAEQYYRAGVFDSAVFAARAAVALDSTFVLAQHRLGTLLLYDQFMETGARHLVRAGAALHARPAGARAAGLSSRDSVVVTLDSLRGAALLAGLRHPGGAPPAELAAPYLARLRQALLVHADDPELRLAYAEALVFMGATARSTREEQHAAYERAIALDSAFFPAYVAAVGLALATHHPERAREHLATMQALTRRNGGYEVYGVMRGVIRPDGTADTASLARWVAGASLSDLAVSFLFLGDWPDSTGAVLRVLRRGEQVARRERPEVWAGIVEPLLRAHLDERGRLAERRALGGAGAAPNLLVRDAMLGALPPAAGDAAAAAWLAGDSAWADPQPLVWLAERADTGGLRRYLARAEGAGDGAGRPLRAVGARLARAYLALAARDTAGALARLRQIPAAECPTACLANDLLRARLLARTGAAAEARAVLAGGTPAGWRTPPTAFDVLWLLERARLAERAGDAATASPAYRTAAGMWATADVPLRSLADEARAGARRTLGAPTR